VCLLKLCGSFSFCLFKQRILLGDLSIRDGQQVLESSNFFIFLGTLGLHLSEVGIGLTADRQLLPQINKLLIPLL